MGFSLKKNEKESRDRLRAFWNREAVDRPALSIIAGEKPFDGKGIWAQQVCEKEKDLDPAWHQWFNAEMLKKNVYLAESMPSAIILWANFCTVIPSMLGVDYDYRDGIAWIEPFPDIYEMTDISFTPNNKVVKSLENILVALSETVGEKGFINPPVLYDAFTMLSRFRGNDTFIFDLLDKPETVLKTSAAITRFYIDTYEHFYKFLKNMGYGDTSAWLPLMAEGKFELPMCDFAVMISPEMFKKFVMPDLESITGYLDYSLYHLDGTCQMRFIDQLASLPGLNGIQWNPEPGTGSPVDWIDAFKEIRSKNLCLYVACDTVEEAVIITRELGPKGLFININKRFKTVEDGEKAIKQIENAC